MRKGLATIILISLALVAASCVPSEVIVLSGDDANNTGSTGISHGYRSGSAGAPGREHGRTSP